MVTIEIGCSNINPLLGSRSLVALFFLETFQEAEEAAFNSLRPIQRGRFMMRGVKCTLSLCTNAVREPWLLRFSLALLFLNVPARASVDAVELTSYPGFENACLAFVVGYHREPGNSKLLNTLGEYQGNCNRRQPLIVNVTHENDRNNHSGSANYDPAIGSYMADFDYKKAVGKWMDIKLAGFGPSSSLMIKLDTQHFHETNVTGWPLQFGHLFLGVTDVTAASALDKSISVDFDIGVDSSLPNVRPVAGIFNGRRVILGALGAWTEASPRTNTGHFLEIDILQTPGYSESYHQPRSPLCNDVEYDRCFYSTGGYAEGREVSFQKILGGRAVPDKTDDWVHIHIPLTELFQRLKWVSPPNNWAEARIKAIYFAIESEGETSTKLEIRNYHVSAEHSNGVQPKQDP
jgi:hypothetical protein